MSKAGYLFAFQGRSFSPDGATEVPPAEIDAHNRKLSEAEVEAFRSAPVGARWFVYYHKRQNADYYGVTCAYLSNWTGDHLAEVTWEGRSFECPAFGYFPSKRRNLRARDPVTGAVWSGTYYESSGDYCRVRRIK